LLETSKVTIPQTYHQAKASFQAVDLQLKMLLGSYHPTYVAYHRFLRGYTNREVFYANRLTRLDLNHGPVLFVRHNQLLLVNWFRQMRTHRTFPPLPAPDFHAVLGMLDLSLSSWVPSLPLKYLPKPIAFAVFPTSATPGRPYASPSAVDGAAREPNVQMLNPARSNKFDAFQEASKTKKLNDGIAKAGNLPTVTRGGQTVPMCGSFHVRGRCFKNCKRAQDHAAHTAEEDDLLHAWCVVALS